MATDYSTELKNTCMLVSDSNETSNQLDSKQLGYGTLVELAKDNLFKKYLDMSKYLTQNQFAAYRKMLTEQYKYLKQMNDALDINGIKPPFRVVDGQVILIEASNLPAGKSPEQYVRDKWNITSEYQLLPISNCMLRGMLDAKDGDQGSVSHLIPEKPDNEKVMLKNENMPPHMHHSSVTTGGNFSTLYGKESSSSYFTPGNIVYDMFYNDSMDVGLSRNELDGTIDKFSVDAQGDSQEMYHDNMPKYHAFYGFVVKNSTR